MYQYINKYSFILIDIFFFIMLFFIVSLIRTNLDVFGFPPYKSIHIYDFLFVIVMIILLLYYEKIYHYRYDFWQETFFIFKALILGFILTWSFLALTRTNLIYSRTFILIYFLLAIFLLPLYKRVIKHYLYKYNFFIQRVYIVGEETQEELFKKELQDNWYLGQIYDSKDYEFVIVASKDFSLDALSEIVDKYLVKHTEIFVVPYMTSLNLAHSDILEYSNIHLNALQIKNNLLIKKNILIKYFFDKTATSLMLPPFLLIHIVIAILIKLDSKGTILFKQKRLGKDGKIFCLYKYRTMYNNSDDIIKKYLHSHPEEILYYKKYHKYKNDPRITKIGKILRSTSLDELPQFLNVLKGDMSLIGPRPYMHNEKKYIKDTKNYILRVKPGITGLWQTNGRNNITFQQRVALDIWYIRNWSLWADIIILLKTIKVVYKKDGAS